MIRRGSHEKEECIINNSLTDITIPASMTEIGKWAFGTCDLLTKIVVAPENENYLVMDGFLVEKETMTLLLYPGGLANGSCSISEGIVKIGESAFMDCAGLTSVTIPATVTEIGAHAFAFCHGLVSVEIPASVRKIGAYAFGDCNNLESIIIPASVTEIGKEAFYGCGKLDAE